MKARLAVAGFLCLLAAAPAADAAKPFDLPTAGGGISRRLPRRLMEKLRAGVPEPQVDVLIAG